MKNVTVKLSDEQSIQLLNDLKKENDKLRAQNKRLSNESNEKIEKLKSRYKKSEFILNGANQLIDIVKEMQELHLRFSEIASAIGVGKQLITDEDCNERNQGY